MVRRQKSLNNSSLEECSSVRSEVILVFADERMVEVRGAQQQTK